MSNATTRFTHHWFPSAATQDKWWISPDSTIIKISAVYSQRSDRQSWDTMLLFSNRFAKVIEHSETNDRNAAKVLSEGHFNNLFNAVEAMEELDSDDSLSISSDAAANARYALVLFQNHKVPTPRLFPQDKEIVVFKWADSTTEKYAYLEDGILSFRIYGPDTDEALTIDFQLDKLVQVGKAVGLLGGIDYSPSANG